MANEEKKEVTKSEDINHLVGKYLTFELKTEMYGLDVMQIMQIIGIPEITPIPRTPEFVKGVINLRGKIIPVIDLRIRFALDQEDYTEETAIIIVEVNEEAGKINIGMIVDKVADVLDIGSEEIERTPSFGVNVESDFILGMAKVKSKIVTLLNISQILTSEEFVELKSLSEQK